MVAGIVAQILQVNPDLNPKQVWEVLTSTASQNSAPDNRLGWGIVDADAAVKAADLLTDTEKLKPIQNQPPITVDAPYPNPFNGSTRFSVEVTQPVTRATLTVYNIVGQEVAQPFTGTLNAGQHNIEFDGQLLPPGLYMYVFNTERGRESGAMVVIR